MRRLLSLAALLAAAASPVLADERMEHAEWASEFYQGTGEASTKEEGMARFGLSCNEDNCRLYYENGINCEPGNNYPIVISTSAGSMAVETICAPAATAGGEVTRYWFTELPQLNDALMQSDAIGIAFPLSNGQFRISQFQMNGYGEATERVASGMRARRAEREALEAADRERRIKEAAERARKAQEAAERARQAAEQAAARKAAEQEAAAERARIAAEKEAAERAKARETATAQPVEPAKVEEKLAEPTQSTASAVEPAAQPTADAKDGAGKGSQDEPDTEPRPGTESTRGKRLPSGL
jgi:chemotaxis protein histidine kinase CheA